MYGYGGILGIYWFFVHNLSQFIKLLNSRTSLFVWLSRKDVSMKEKGLTQKAYKR